MPKKLSSSEKKRRETAKKEIAERKGMRAENSRMNERRTKKSRTVKKNKMVIPNKKSRAMSKLRSILGNNRSLFRNMNMNSNKTSKKTIIPNKKNRALAKLKSILGNNKSLFRNLNTAKSVKPTKKRKTVRFVNRNYGPSMRKMFEMPKNYATPTPPKKTIRKKRVLNNNNYSKYVNDRYVNVSLPKNTSAYKMKLNEAKDLLKTEKKTPAQMFRTMKSNYCKLLEEPNENNEQLQSLYRGLRVMDKLKKSEEKIRGTTVGKKQTIVKGQSKPCPEGKELNPASGRCRIACKENQKRSDKTGRCIKA